jgi:hypothetical protein
MDFLPILSSFQCFARLRAKTRKNDQGKKRMIDFPLKRTRKRAKTGIP